MKETIIYHEGMGKAYTDETLRVAKEKAAKAGIKTIIVSSAGFYTAGKALDAFKGTGVKLIVVGFSDPSPEVADRLAKGGHRHINAGKHKFDHPAEAWELLRRFGEGMKVAIQEVLMATELGLVPEGEEVIALGGTGTIDFAEGGGCDTAVVMQAVKGASFFKLAGPMGETKKKGRYIKEILCKPR